MKISSFVRLQKLKYSCEYTHEPILHPCLVVFICTLILELVNLIGRLYNAVSVFFEENHSLLNLVQSLLQILSEVVFPSDNLDHGQIYIVVVDLLKRLSMRVHNHSSMRRLKSMTFSPYFKISFSDILHTMSCCYNPART